jgi:MerR family transcriptional regulator, copper efflux regulator
MPPAHDLSIGQVATRTGLSVPTIRYYEEIGLVRRVGRRQGGHRAYGAAELSRLTFVAQCRDIGFTIEQTRSLIAIAIDDRPCADAKTIAQMHLTAIDAKLAELTAIRLHLDGFVKRCSAACADGPASACTMIDDLSRQVPTLKRRRLG